jgi:hypothetical protein
MWTDSVLPSPTVQRPGKYQHEYQTDWYSPSPLCQIARAVRPIHPGEAVYTSAKRRQQFGNLYEEHLYFLRDVSRAIRARANAPADIDDGEDKEGAYVDLRPRFAELLSTSRQMLQPEELELLYPRYEAWVRASRGVLDREDEARVFKDLLAEWNPVLHGISHLESGFEVDEAAELVKQKWDELIRKRGVGRE